MSRMNKNPKINDRFKVQECFGRVDSFSGWARWIEENKGFKISSSTIRSRIKDGWTLEQALTTPPNIKMKRPRIEAHNEFSEKKMEQIRKELNPNGERLIDFKKLAERRPDVIDRIPGNGHFYDVNVMMRGSSSCVYWTTQKDIDEIDLARLMKETTVLHIEVKGEHKCRMSDRLPKIASGN